MTIRFGADLMVVPEGTSEKAQSILLRGTTSYFSKRLSIESPGWKVWLAPASNFFSPPFRKAVVTRWYSS
jgi:hypothetical protein